MKLRPTAFVLAPVLLALLVAGCGEKEEPPTTGPVVAQTTTATTTTTTDPGNGQGGRQATAEQRIRATITGYLVKPNDPSVCDELITPRFLKASYGNRQGCVAARKPSGLAKNVTIAGKAGENVWIVKPQGGVFGGETLKVTVVKSGNDWRIDEIASNAKVGP